MAIVIAAAIGLATHPPPPNIDPTNQADDR
jgi:hypothetical protein